MEDLLKALNSAKSLDSIKIVFRDLETLFETRPETEQAPKKGGQRSARVGPSTSGSSIALLLKLCFGKVNIVNQEDNQKASIYAAAAMLGIDSLSTLQGLKPLEVEIQRYNLIRRLVSWQMHGAALYQGWILFASVCYQVAAGHAAQGGKKDRLLADARSCNRVGARLPDLLANAEWEPFVRDLIASGFLELQAPAAKEVNELVTLVVGSILNLLICLSEMAPLNEAALRKLLPAVEKVELWISKLDEVAASKHRDSLFRCLYKVASQLLANAGQSPPEATFVKLASSYSTLALSACSRSSSQSRFMQVAIKLCRSLTGWDLTSGLDLHEACLQGGFLSAKATPDNLALIASYTQVCIDHEAAPRGCKVLQHLQETDQIAGIHVFLLLLNSGPEPTRKTSQKKASKSGLQEHLSSFHQALSALKDMLQKASLQSTGNSAPTAEVELLSKVPLLELLRKAVSKFVEDEWQVWLASEGSTSGSSGKVAKRLQAALVESFQAWELALETLSRMRKESAAKNDAWSKMISASPSVMTSKMRLLLMDACEERNKSLVELQVASEESIKALSDVDLGRELKTLSSSMYNIGVHLFNQQQYHLAKHPLSIASSAAWTLANMVFTSDQVTSANAESSCSDIVHDACSKTASHADCCRREGDMTTAIDALAPGFRGLCNLKGAFASNSSKMLIKQLVKIQAMDPSTFVHSHLHQHLREAKWNPSDGQLGFILEEILAALEAEKGKAYEPVILSLVDLLLISVYCEASHPIRRARLLVERARLSAGEDSAAGIADLKAAIKLQEAVLKDVRRVGEDSDTLPSLEDECALAKSLLLLAKQQEDPHQDVKAAARAILDSWKAVLERGNVSSASFCNPARTQTALLELADLLAVKGLSSLQQEALQLALGISHVIDPSTPLSKHCASLLSNCRLPHLLCCKSVPEQAEFLNGLKEKHTKGSKESNKGCPTWEEVQAHCLGSILDARVKSSAECCCGELPSTSGQDSNSTVEQLREMIKQSTSIGKRAVVELVKQGALLQLLAERLLFEGRRDEALCEATEALRVRFGVFEHVLEAETKTHEETEDDVQQRGKSASFKLTGLARRAGWPSMYSEQTTIEKTGVLQNPWRIAGDYLESLLLVGSLSESAGMVDSAEQNFREGRRVADAVGATYAEAVFHSSMGEVKRKKGDWQAANEAFERASKLLSETPSDCEGCRTLTEARLKRRQGDLIRRQPLKNEEESAVQHYEKAAKLLQSIAGSKVDAANRTNGNVEKEAVVTVKRNLMWAMAEAESSSEVSSSKAKAGRKPKSEPKLERVAEVKKGRGGRKKVAPDVITIGSSESEGESCISVVESRSKTVRRGPKRGRALESSASELESEASSTSVTVPPKAPARKTQRGRKLRGSTTGSDAASESSPPVAARHAHLDKTQEKVRRVVRLEEGSVLPALRGSRLGKRAVDVAEMDALQARVEDLSLNRAEASGDGATESEPDFAPWRRAATEELADVLLQQSKCSSSPDDRGLLLQALSLLKTCHAANSPCPGSYSLTEAAVLYHLSFHPATASCGQLSSPVAMLIRAYDLSTSAPLLFKKVALRLALLHSTPLGDDMAPEDAGHVAPDPRLAAYYHQAAVGASSVQQHLAVVDTKLAALSRSCESEATPERRELLEDLQAALSISKLSHIDWKADFQTRVLSGLPPGCAVCCISLVRSTLNSESDPSLLITRMTSDKTRKPVCVRLPLPMCASSEASSSGYDELSDEESDDVMLRSALEEVLECFSDIMEESRKSTSGEADSAAQKKRWWQWRLTLDRNLGATLQTMEDSWLGPWRCLLVGEPPMPSISAAYLRAANDLKKRMDAAKQGRAEWAASMQSGPCVELELLRLLLQSVHLLPDGALEAAITELLEWSPEVAEKSARSVRKVRIQSEEESDGEEDLETRQAKLVTKLADEFRRVASDIEAGGEEKKRSGGRKTKKEGAGTEREARLPVVLVLDADLQALPWESLPILRSSRVYRAPSVASIRALLARSRHSDLAGAGLTEQRPGFTVNAANTFYLLNPSGDLESTQASFEQWFTSQEGWQGLVNRLPSVEQLLSSLRERDLFVYLGHGSGEQFLPSRSLRRLQQCAAAFLMGCSSGKLSLKGDYEPVGAVLSYLVAGSPVAVANLWDVTDGDIDRFSKMVLQRWLQSESSDEGSEGSIVVEAGRGGNREVPPAEKCISTVVAAGRTACILPFLIGAAPVCYGVPTGVTVRD